MLQRTLEVPATARHGRTSGLSSRQAAWPLAPLLQVTRAVPIVFVYVPIRSAPASLKAWRDRAATHRIHSDRIYSTSGKWLELLKQIAPGVTRAAIIRELATSTGFGQLAAIQAVAPSLGGKTRWENKRGKSSGWPKRNQAAWAKATQGGRTLWRARPRGALGSRNSSSGGKRLRHVDAFFYMPPVVHRGCRQPVPGRSRRARSGRSGCGASACSLA